MQPNLVFSRLQTAWTPMLNDAESCSYACFVLYVLLAWAGLQFGAQDSRASQLHRGRHTIATG